MARHLDRSVGVWAGLLALAYIPFLPSNAVVGRWIILQVGAALLFCLIRVKWSPSHILGVLFLSWMLLSSTFWAVSGFDAVGGTIQWLALGLVFCIGYELRDTKYLWWGLVLGISTSLPFALLQKVGYDSVWMLPGSSGVFGTYLSQNMAAEAGVIGVVAALALSQWWLVPVPLTIAYLSHSRAIYPVLLAVLVTLLWSSYPKLRAWSIPVGLGLAVVLFGVYEANLISDDWFRMSDRLEIWALVGRNLHWYGDGLNSLPVAATTIEFAHNEVLHYAFELGVGSLPLWAIACYALQGNEAYTKSALVVVLVFAMVWFPLHEPLAGFVLAICAGYLCHSYDLARSLQSTRRISGVYRPGYDNQPLGVGALQLADVGRRDLSVGSEYSLGRPHLLDRCQEAS